MKLFFLGIILFMGSCTSIFYTQKMWFSMEIRGDNLSPSIPTSIFPTFTPVSTSITKIPTPTREIYVSVTSPPIFLTSTPSIMPSPTIGLCAGVVIDSLSKRKNPSINALRVGGLSRGMIVQFSEYSPDRKWLHLLDGSWAKIQNDSFPFNLYLDIGAC